MGGRGEGRVGGWGQEFGLKKGSKNYTHKQINNSGHFRDKLYLGLVTKMSTVM